MTEDAIEDIRGVHQPVLSDDPLPLITAFSASHDAEVDITSAVGEEALNQPDLGQIETFVTSTPGEANFDSEPSDEATQALDNEAPATNDSIGHPQAPPDDNNNNNNKIGAHRGSDSAAGNTIAKTTNEASHDQAITQNDLAVDRPKPVGCEPVDIEFSDPELHAYAPRNVTDLVPVDLSCDWYDVVLVSVDEKHRSGYQTHQTEERWRVEGFNAVGDVVYRSPSIDDLPDDLRVLEQTVEVANLRSVVELRAVHYGSSGVDSIHASARLVPAESQSLPLIEQVTLPVHGGTASSTFGVEISADSHSSVVIEQVPGDGSEFGDSWSYRLEADFPVGPTTPITASIPVSAELVDLAAGDVILQRYDPMRQGWFETPSKLLEVSDGSRLEFDLAVAVPLPRFVAGLAAANTPATEVRARSSLSSFLWRQLDNALVVVGVRGPEPECHNRVSGKFVSGSIGGEVLRSCTERIDGGYRIKIVNNRTVPVGIEVARGNVKRDVQATGDIIDDAFVAASDERLLMPGQEVWIEMAEGQSVQLQIEPSGAAVTTYVALRSAWDVLDSTFDELIGRHPIKGQRAAIVKNAIDCSWDLTPAAESNDLHLRDMDGIVSCVLGAISTVIDSANLIRDDNGRFVTGWGKWAERQEILNAFSRTRKYVDFGARVIDFAGAMALDSYPVLIGDIELQIVGPDELPPARLGEAYSAPLTALGGSGQYTWHATRIAPGLYVQQGGRIAGWPTAGTAPEGFEVLVTVEDVVLGLGATRRYTLVVEGDGELTPVNMNDVCATQFGVSAFAEAGSDRWNSWRCVQNVGGVDLQSYCATVGQHGRAMLAENDLSSQAWRCAVKVGQEVSEREEHLGTDDMNKACRDHYDLRAFANNEDNSAQGWACWLNLGGLDLQRYCRTLGADAVRVGDGLDWDDWRCRFVIAIEQSESLISVDMDVACQEQYGPAANAGRADVRDAYSWRCVMDGQLHDVDVEAYCQRRGANHVSVNPRDANSWKCVELTTKPIFRHDDISVHHACATQYAGVVFASNETGRWGGWRCIQVTGPVQIDRYCSDLGGTAIKRFEKQNGWRCAIRRIVPTVVEKDVDVHAACRLQYGIDVTARDLTAQWDGWRCYKTLGAADLTSYCSGRGGTAMRIGERHTDWHCSLPV